MENVTTGGLSNSLILVDKYEICKGIYFKKTYCHFFQTNMLAFTRAHPGKAHPAPWVALPGSKGNDIEVEIVIEDDNLYKEYIEPYNLIWLIVSLVRVCFKPNINICILSKCGIESKSTTSQQAARYEENSLE